MEPKLSGWKQEEKLDSDKSFSSSKLYQINNTSGGLTLREFTPISNQLNLSTCVANATVDSLEILRGLKDQNSVTQLSRLFTYFNARNYDEIITEDSGTYIRRAFQSLSDFGVCPEDDWPYLESSVFLQPPIICYRTASDNRINDFYRITETDDDRVEAIIQALENSHPVVFGARLNRDFFYTTNNIVQLPKTTFGAHAMVITGWKVYSSNIIFYVRNSWGSSWGDSTGHCWISSEYIKSDLCDDFWVPTIEAPNNF